MLEILGLLTFIFGLAPYVGSLLKNAQSIFQYVVGSVSRQEATAPELSPDAKSVLASIERNFVVCSLLSAVIILLIHRFAPGVHLVVPWFLIVSWAYAASRIIYYFCSTTLCFGQKVKNMAAEGMFFVQRCICSLYAYTIGALCNLILKCIVATSLFVRLKFLLCKAYLDCFSYAEDSIPIDFVKEIINSETLLDLIKIDQQSQSYGQTVANLRKRFDILGMVSKSLTKNDGPSASQPDLLLVYGLIQRLIEDYANGVVSTSSDHNNNSSATSVSGVNSGGVVVSSANEVRKILYNTLFLAMADTINKTNSDANPPGYQPEAFVGNAMPLTHGLREFILKSDGRDVSDSLQLSAGIDSDVVRGMIDNTVLLAQVFAQQLALQGSVVGTGSAP